MFQPLTTDKLHKTNVKDNASHRCRSVRVKGIGLRTSKVSDVTTAPLFLIGPSGGHRPDYERGWSPLLSFAWISFPPAKSRGSKAL